MGVIIELFYWYCSPREVYGDLQGLQGPSVYSVIGIVLKQFPTGVLCILAQGESNCISFAANLSSQKSLSSYYLNSSCALRSLG